MAGDGKVIIQTDIADYPWDGTYRPKAQAELKFLDGQGFEVRMRCYETQMRAVNTEPDSPVYQDSCLECFLNFYPEESKVYINFEVNSNGTMLCQRGENKKERTFIRDMGYEQPVVQVNKTEEFWEVSYLIPLELIGQIYGKAGFEAGHRIAGNFYKCGDLTQAEHYGCWNHIENPKPNFHLPEFFGDMILSDN